MAWHTTTIHAFRTRRRMRQMIRDRQLRRWSSPVRTCSRQAPRARPSIVVIDDDPAVQQLMYDLLVDEGYAVALERADSAVVDRLRRAPPALMIVDIHDRCQESRLSVLMQVRHHAAMPALPIVVTVTSAQWIDANDAAIAALNLHVLLKPFEVPLFLETLATLLG